MGSWCRWLLCACVVEAVRFNDRLLMKKPMKTTGEVLEILSLSKRQNIPGIGHNVPMIRGASGPVATLLNIKESDSDARAAVQGLTNYDGDLVIPRETVTPVGFPVSVNIDRDPDDFERGDGPLFKLFPKDALPIRKDTSGKSEEEKKEDEDKKKQEEEKKKVDDEIKKKEDEKRKLEVEKLLLEAEKKKLEKETQKKEADELAEKARKEAVEKKKIEAEVRLKLIEEIRQLEDDRKNKEEQRKRNEEEKKRKDQERKKLEFEKKKKEDERRKGEERRKLEEARKKVADEKIKAQSRISEANKNTAGNNTPRDKNFICYLPKIVVITRMIGSMVVNEVKVYGDSHNEKSVHKFISTHVVSANASELINEFTLPPQFTLGVSPEVEKDNDVSITKTAAYTNAGQLNIPGVVIKRPIQAPRVAYQTRIPIRVQQSPAAQRPVTNYNYGPHFTTREPTQSTLVPTYNPFLPTTKTSTVATTTTSTTSTTTTTTTAAPQTTLTTTTTTTPTTTTTTTAKPASDTTSKPKPWNIDIISDFVAKKSNVKSKDDAKRVLEWLNYVARHRNAANDVPAGDPNTFTGYQMVPPNYSI